MQPVTRILTVLAFLTLHALPAGAQFYYGLYQEYGKNRVEYQEFDWTFYRYERYDVYHYENGQDIARQVSRMVGRQIPLLENSLDVPLEERLQIMVFNSLTDLKQSNLNLSDEEAFNTSGVTHYSGNRIFVYADGDYTSMEGQIREGLAGVALNALMYGSFTRNLRNSSLLNLPEWYTKGLLAYLAYPYSGEIELQVFDGLASGTMKRVNNLSDERARLAGHSIWHYIAQTYGATLIRNVVYTTVSERSVDRGLEYNLGIDSETLFKNWRASKLQLLNDQYSGTRDRGSEIRRSRKDEVFSRPRLSPDGKHLAYVANRLGEYRVYLTDLEDHSRKRIMKKGYLINQNADYSYPMIAWHPNGRVLAILLEEKGLYRLYFYDRETEELESREFFGFQKVSSFRYSRDGTKFLLSGFRNGQSDIFLYTLLSRTIDPLTNDGYADLDPIFLKNDRFVVFRSNRVDDSLRTGQQVYNHPDQFDLFIYRMDRDKDQVLWRLSTPDATREYNMRPVERGYFGYLADAGMGLPEEYLVRLDSSIALVDTSTHYRYITQQASLEMLPHGTVDFDFHADSRTVARIYLLNGRYRISAGKFAWPQGFAPGRSRELYEEMEEPETPTGMDVPDTKAEVDIHNYVFDPEALKTIDVEPVRTPRRVDVAAVDSLFGEDFRIPPNRNYFLTWMQDEFSVKIDNVFNYPQYQPFTGTPGAGLINTGFNTFFKVGVVDIMNDYRIVAGFRTDFQPVPGVSLSPNSELLFGFINRKKRLDKTITLYRRSQIGIIPDRFLTVRHITYEGHHKWNWPFNPVAAIRFSAGLRNHRQIVLAESSASVNPNELDAITAVNYGILKAEYVYDNTRKKGINLYHGMRYKVFSEFYENFNSSNSGLFTAGIDWRHYMPVHREIIWANRFAYGTSFGNELLLHYLGGVDNVFVPGFMNNTPFAQDQNYVFQTVVTNMRGFHQNIRNGNSFSVINSELRVPIVRYLYNRPLQNDFLANFQIIGFGDLGTAWNGLHPYSQENAINTRTVVRNGYTVVLDTQRDPLVAGFGFGVRSRLLGYFCRLDWAWGVEDGRVLDRVFYFSLSTDF